MTKKIATRVGMNKDGTLDEIVADRAYIHLEQMDGCRYWMAVSVDGKAHTIWFTSKRRIMVSHEVAPLP